jgi:hypothetical protein
VAEAEVNLLPNGNLVEGYIFFNTTACPVPGRSKVLAPDNAKICASAASNFSGRYIHFRLSVSFVLNFHFSIN